MSKYFTTGTLTSVFQTLLGLTAAVFPGVFSASVQAEATTAVAGLIGGVFGVVHLIQHIRANVK